MIQKYKYELILAIILIGFTAFQWDSLFLPYFWDELAYYSKAALYMNDNGLSLLPNGLLPDLSRGHPLLFQFLGGLWFKIFGTSLFVGHSLPFVISLLALVFTFKVGSIITNKLYGLLAAILLLIQPIFITQSALILPEIALALFTLLSIYFLLKENILISLLFSILTVFVKEVGVVIPFAILIYIYWNTKSIKKASLFLLPFLLLTIFFIIQRFQNGWFFFPFHVSLISFDLQNFVYSFVKGIYFIFIAQGRFLFSSLFLFLGYYLFKNKLSPFEKNFVVLSILILLTYMIINSLYRGMNRYFLFIFPLITICISLAISKLKGMNRMAIYLIIIMLLSPFFFLHNPKSFNIDGDLGYKNCISATQKTYDYVIDNNLTSKNGYCHFSLLRAFGDSRLGYTNEEYINLHNNQNMNVDYAIEINPNGWNRNLDYWNEFKLAKSIKEGNFEILIFTK